MAIFDFEMSKCDLPFVDSCYIYVVSVKRKIDPL